MVLACNLAHINGLLGDKSDFMYRSLQGSDKFDVVFTAEHHQHTNNRVSQTTDYPKMQRVRKWHNAHF